MSAGEARPSGALRTATPAETERLGARIAAALRPGDVVLLRGDLGAGKTTLVRGVARALGAAGPVTSPTFALAHRYDLPEGRRVAHLDLYRLAGLGDEDEELVDEELDGGAIGLVEWPDAVAPLLGDRVRLEVDLHHDGGDGRRIELRWRP
jgi:tRNA threonylcarbamoyladenosine biosynthesis protein TsaE